jgi:transcription elongation factor Elf1
MNSKKNNLKSGGNSMSLKFKCRNCGQDIVSKHLKIGEEAQCKNCGARNEIPKSAINTDDTQVYEEYTGTGETYKIWLQNINTDGTQVHEEYTLSASEPTRIKVSPTVIVISLIVVVIAIFNYIIHPGDVKYLAPDTSLLSSAKTASLEIVSVNSEWDWSGGLLCPQLQIQFKNTSNKDIDRLEVKASFINSSNNEIFGDAYALVIGSIDAPLRPGYSKTAYLASRVGYKNDMVALDFPPLVAEVYVNDVFYDKVPISKKYAGVDWTKK